MILEVNPQFLAYAIYSTELIIVYKKKVRIIYYMEKLQMQIAMEIILMV